MTGDHAEWSPVRVSQNDVSELNDLRNEVARMRRAATRKISRIKTVHGAQVSGTEFDPRRDTQIHTHYTAKQLAAYKSKLADFLSRSNQFVPDAQKQPMPRAEFQEYKRREAKYRATAGTVYERIKDENLPSGETVAERLEKMRPKHKAMHNTAMNAIFDPLTRDPGDIVSRRALNKLAKSLAKASSPSEIRRKVNDARDQLNQMLDVLNVPEVQAEIAKLNNDQFVAMWNYTNVPAASSLAYLNAKKLLSAKEDAWAWEQIRHQMGDMMESVTWASRLRL